MHTFKELRKAARKEMMAEYRLAIVGNVATQFLATAIKGESNLQEYPIEVFDADYNQILAQLVDSNSEVFEFKPDGILLWMDSYKLYEDFLSLPLPEKNGFAQSFMDEILSYWEMVAKNSKAKIIQPNFCEIDDRTMGNLSSKVDSSFIYQIRKLNYLLEEAASANGNVFILDLLSLQNRFGSNFFHDDALYYNAKMTISMDGFPYVACNVMQIIKAIKGSFKKCLVMDLDNTIWGGVIGDDGLSGIEIGELGRGHAFQTLQKWIKNLKDNGIILAVCSKNNEDIAKEPFEKLEEMVLRLDDISVFVANWEDKASNIKLIRETLNIGMDSLVFIDDNPFERNLVREMIPEITVPELPEDPAMYLDYLQSCNLFEVASVSEDSSKRTKQYQQEFARRKQEMSYENYDDYLISMEMEAIAKKFEELKYPRIAQLTQRSNQFNLRTIRYTESDIKEISNNDEYIPIYFTLEDKYGDYGLISVLIMKKEDNSTLFVETWLMSCRVLKRGMEEFIINKMVSLAKENGFKRIVGEYLPTAKNKMVSDIYQRMGFEKIADNRYAVDVGTYQNNKTFIKEKYDE